MIIGIDCVFHNELLGIEQHTDTNFLTSVVQARVGVSLDHIYTLTLSSRDCGVLHNIYLKYGGGSNNVLESVSLYQVSDDVFKTFSKNGKWTPSCTRPKTMMYIDCKNVLPSHDDEWSLRLQWHKDFREIEGLRETLMVIQAPIDYVCVTDHILR